MWARVFISDCTWFDIFHDLPDVVGIPFGIEMLSGEYKDRWISRMQRPSLLYRCFFAKSCLCGIIIVMASVRRFWCNRIIYCPQSIGGEKHLSWLLIFLFYFGLGRRGTVHENLVVVIFPVAEAGEVACRIRGKPYTCTVIQWQVMV